MITKLDPEGDLVWRTAAANAGTSSLAIDGNGSLYASGGGMSR